MKCPTSSTLSHLRLLVQQPFQDFSAPLSTEPIDIVVRSAQTIKQWEHVPGSFAHQLLTEGIVLYDRQKQPA